MSFKQNISAEQLEHFKNHPFIMHKESDIKTRAYFCWKNKTGTNPDDAYINWLQAEIEEIYSQLPGLVSVRINDSIEPPFSFGNHFRVIDCHKFPRELPQKMHFLGEKDWHCSVCNQTKSRKDFKKAAHLIPESLGNKWLFTHNECDECNDKIGKLYENELGLFLSPIRAAGRIRGKSGEIMHKRSHLAKSSIGGQQSGHPLEVVISETDPSITFSFPQKNKIEFEVDSPPFNPMYVAKAIFKVGFHSLDRASKLRYERLRKWIHNPMDDHPVLFAYSFTPGPGLSNVGAATWESRNLTSSYPTLITQVFSGNFIITCFLPEFNGENFSYILPELPLSPYWPHEPQTNFYKVMKSEKIKPDPVKLGFAFSKIRSQDLRKI